MTEESHGGAGHRPPHRRGVGELLVAAAASVVGTLIALRPVGRQVKAHLMERYRRGKAHRARTGSVNVLSGAPFGYRYVRKSECAGAAYEITGHDPVLVAVMFRHQAAAGTWPGLDLG